MGHGLKINDVIRIKIAGMLETHRVTRTHSVKGGELTYAYAGCGAGVTGRDMLPWAPVADGSEPTCGKCAGTGPTVRALTPDPALDTPNTQTPRGWTAGRKGKGVTMHGIPDPDAVSHVAKTSGRGKNKITTQVPVWESACGEIVSAWDADGEPVTQYAPHATDAGNGGIRWCGNCAATFKALRGPVAPPAVLTSKTPDNVGRYGETTDAQDRANARAAWRGRVLPLLTLTLGEFGETVGTGSLVVVGTGGPVHAGALDGHGRMMLVCRTGVLSRNEWQRPGEERDTVTCPGCKEVIFGESGAIRPLVMGAIMRPESLSDLERFAPVDSGSGMTDHTAGTDTVASVTALARMADTDASARRFPFDRPRGEFRTGARAKGDKSPYTEDERKARRAAERDDLTNGRARLWNKIEFVPSHASAPAGRRHLTMIISRNVAERLWGMFTGPDGNKITGWDYVYAMGRLPGSVSAVLTSEERARLYGGGKTLAKRATAARKDREERGRTARVGAIRDEWIRSDREERRDGRRAVRGAAVYGAGRDFSDRAGSRVI